MLREWILRLGVLVGLAIVAYAECGVYQNMTGRPEFEQNVKTVLEYLSQQVPLTNYSAAYTGEFPDVCYGEARCNNRTSQKDCSTCFEQWMPWFLQLKSGGAGCNVTNCYFRYDNYNFLPANFAVHLPLENTTSSNSTPSNSTAPSPENKTALVPVVVLSIAVPAALAGACLIYYYRRTIKSRPVSHLQNLDASVEGPRVYQYEELQDATGDFSEHNKLGKGGYGAVYRGVLKDGMEVAVKKLNKNCTDEDFIHELNIINKIQHRNLVKLKGYCVQEHMLVLDYLVNGSLQNALFSGGPSLDWSTRFSIAIGISRGLGYLHEESHFQIIHRDIKASNILLDEKFNPMICDFGLSKLFNLDRSLTSTRVAGTFGYLAPEYAIHGHLTIKVDVFSFGVLLLELVSGRKCNEPTQLGEVLLGQAWKLHETHQELGQLKDARMNATGPYEGDVLRVLSIALLCTQQKPEDRPIMSKVLAMLLGYLDLPPLPAQAPAYLCTAHNSSHGSSPSTASFASRIEAR